MPSSAETDKRLEASETLTKVNIRLACMNAELLFYHNFL